jgi:mannose-6-phosphate isomerase-like protein (cupin superfamily)
MLASILEPSRRESGPAATASLLDVALRAFADRPIFTPSGALLHPDNPFRRPLLNEEFGGWPEGQSFTLGELRGNSSLVANRVLLSVYEQDFVFLPRAGFREKTQDFTAFYDRESRVFGEILSCWLERLLFDCVSDAVQVSGRWDLPAFVAYFDDFKDRLRAEAHEELMNFIPRMSDPVAGATMYLVQLAGDFLVESSAMTRNVVGNYGPIQSELFKVVIDECGYGVYSTKHSTLFQVVLESLGLDPVPHTYWQLYLPTSMYLNNYFNSICRDHAKFFRYLGAILQVETAFRVTCSQMARMMTSVFGPSAEVNYFREHTHIDDHHSRMVLEKIITPAVKEYGDTALEEIVRGFEESLVVADQFTLGVRRQLEWIEAAGQGRGGVLPAHSGAELRRDPSGTLRGTRMSDDEVTYEVLSGSLELFFGLKTGVVLKPGESLRVPAGVLYGVRAEEECEYQVRRGGGGQP